MKVTLSKESIDALAKALARELKGTHELLTCAQAAKMLGVTTQTMRLNKDKYRHTKVGDTKQGRLMFDRRDIEQSLN